MSEIDWSKAPEWATRLMKNRQGTPDAWADNARKAIWVTDFIRVGEAIFNLDQSAWTVIAERPSPAWSGEGLPPVGTVCEVRQKTPYESSFEWEECRIAMINTGADGLPQVCTIDKRGDFAIYYPATDIVEFRPTRTPEQIAADEREAAIEEMTQIINKNLANTIAASAIYDAGYRKP